MVVFGLADAGRCEGCMLSECRVSAFGHVANGRWRKTYCRFRNERVGTSVWIYDWVIVAGLRLTFIYIHLGSFFVVLVVVK